MHENNVKDIYYQVMFSKYEKFIDCYNNL